MQLAVEAQMAHGQTTSPKKDTAPTGALTGWALNQDKVLTQVIYV